MPIKLFTSEAVTEGHPDKVCDQIADSVLDGILENDPDARVACEVSATTGMILIMGEITTDCYVDIPRIARDTIRDIGYNKAEYGFDAATCSVLTSIKEQSPDIRMGVDSSYESRNSGAADTGAGDQGMMFGFACDETKELMPLPHSVAQALAMRLAYVRKAGLLTYLRPDGKTQVTVKYEGDKPLGIDTIVVAAQHDDGISADKIKKDILEYVVRPVVDEGLISADTKYYVNPTGRFVIGGPHGDTGLTGRKLMVDTYGGYARHGGGAFSGKDPTKVDRSASYMARYAAKNIVAAGLASRCEIQLAYAIGMAQPVSIFIDSFGTAKIPEEKIISLVKEHFDMRPGAIIKKLDLRRPIYRPVSVYGHFGRPDLQLSWEMTDKAAALRAGAGL